MGLREDKLSELSRLRKLDELKSLRAGSAPKPLEPSMVEKVGSEVGAFLGGGGESLGEKVPIIGPLGRMAGQGFRAVIEGGLSDKETIPEAYGRIDAENDAKNKRFAEEHPVADTARTLLGGIGGAGAIPVPGAAVKGVLGAGARIAGSAGTIAGDAAMRGESADRIKQAVTLSGGIQAGLEAVPVVGKVAGPAARAVGGKVSALGEYLSNAAAMRAAKAGLGNNKRAWDKLGNKAVSVGKTALDEGVVSFGNSAGNIAAKGRDAADKSWQGVEAVFLKADDAGIKINGAEIADEIEAMALKIDPIGKSRPVVASLKKEAEDIRNLGEISLSKAQELKKKFEYKITDTNTHALAAEGNNAVNQSFASAIKRKVADSGLDGADEFVANYNKAGALGEFARNAKKTDTQLTKNRSPFSLTDYIAGGAGGAAAASITGDPKDAGAIALITAAANSLARNRGNSAMAVGLNKLANTIKSKPEQVRKFYGVLEEAAKRGQASLAVTHQMMLNTNPEYKAAVEGTP